MHIVHSGKDAAAVPKGAQCLIMSYNFVPKMVGVGGLCVTAPRGAMLVSRRAAGALPPADLPAAHAPPLQDLAKQFKVGERWGREAGLPPQVVHLGVLIYPAAA